MILYTSSCRYMYGGKLPLTCFPARLHTTTEVLYFLENIGRLSSNLLQEIPEELQNYVFGDIFDPIVKDLSQSFLEKEKEIVSHVTGLVMEVCSRKLYLYDGTIPINNFYINCHGGHLVKKYDLKLIHLSDDDLSNDLIKIKKLVSKRFPSWRQESQIHILPHLSLKTINLQNSYIPERHSLKTILKHTSQTMGIEFHDIGELLEQYHFTTLHQENDLFLEDVMKDSLHYDYTPYFDALFHHLASALKRSDF